jgi:class 3 adenylate cyclase
MQISEWKRLMKDIEVPKELTKWLEQANDEQLFRINLKELAPRLGIELRPLLEIFLHAVRAGAFSLNWAYYCTFCGGLPGFKHNFNELKTSEKCPLCNSVFRNSLDTNVAVTFTVHPALHPIPEALAKKAFDAMVQTFQNKESSLPKSFLSGLEVLNSAVFRELFGEDVLSVEESLDVNRVTLLFTDIKDSTRMYSRYGDATSYRIVRDHFKTLFNEVEKNGGVVVKTIGDAVMASFLRPSDGMRAALGAFEAFQKITWDALGGGLEIKMGLHSGGVIVVNLNDRVDYFGNAVNLAARIQGTAENHMICFSQEILDDPEVKKTLLNWTKERQKKIWRKKTSLKGIEGQVELYSLT